MKTNKIVQIVSLSLLAVILLGVMIYGISCRGMFNYNISCGGFREMNGYVTLDNQITDDIKEIEIDWVAGNIDISASSEIDKISVEEIGYKKESDRLLYKVENGKLKIVFYKNRLFNCNVKKDLKIVVPKTDDCDLESLNIDSVSAKITLNDITIPNVDIETVSGNFITDNSKINLLDIDGVSSDILIKGEINKLLVETVSGDVTVDTVFDVPTIKVDTVSGDLKIKLIGEKGFKATFETVSGNLSSDFSTKSLNDTYIYLDGSNEYKFESVSGDLSIVKK